MKIASWAKLANIRSPLTIVTSFGNSGTGTSRTSSFTESSAPESWISSFPLSQIRAMVNVDFDAGRLQRALKKALGAINNFDWTGLRLAHRVPCTAGVNLTKRLNCSYRLRQRGQSIHDSSPRDSSDMA